MIRLHLAVNDRHGNVTDTCQGIHVEIDGETVMIFEAEAAFQENPEHEPLPNFLEIPDDLIQIGNIVLRYDGRHTMVGNVFWNCYDVFSEDVVLLLNDNTGDLNLVEAMQPLWDKWQSGDRFTVEDLERALIDS